MDTLTKLILTPLVGAARPLVTGYIRLLARVCGNEVRKMAPLLGLRSSGLSRFPGANSG
jgi:hypothetical protein